VGLSEDLAAAGAAAELVETHAATLRPDRHAFLATLCLALFRRARVTGSSADLDRAVEAGCIAAGSPGANASSAQSRGRPGASRRGAASPPILASRSPYRTVLGAVTSRPPEGAEVGLDDSLRLRAQDFDSRPDADVSVVALREAGPPPSARALFGVVRRPADPGELVGRPHRPRRGRRRGGDRCSARGLRPDSCGVTDSRPAVADDLEA
jgi:hypothetical protein